MRCLAQEIDTAILSNQEKPFTILDQVDTDKERHAFLKLYEERNARTKRDLAESFLTNYPQSWLLSTVYELAAKASIDLGDYSKALRYGQDSLALLPENTLLLVPLAGVQVQQGLLIEGKQTAHQALECLDRFSRPSSISEKLWPTLERQLKASAYYTLGKAETVEALSVKESSQEQRLRQGERFLNLAVELNPRDAEILYLMGLNARALGKTHDATTRFAQVYEMGGPLKTKALAQLERIYNAGSPVSGENFEAFLTRIRPRNDSPKVSLPPPEAQTRSLEYAGSVACQRCHEPQYSAWQRTGMAKMFRPYQSANVLGDFVKNNQFQSAEGHVQARMIMDQTQHYFEIRDDRGQWNRYRVDYTIGSKWQQAYATRLPDGQVHVFPIQYNVLRKQWLNYWKIIDLPGSIRARVEGFPSLTQSTSYQMNCAACHTSQLRLLIKSGPVKPEYATFREAGINCEMCHGPSARHIADILSGKQYLKSPTDPPVQFRTVNNREYVAICAQCHMQSGIRIPRAHGEINFSEAGERFYSRYSSVNYTDFSRKAFYRDGRFRETTFIVESFLRTACFNKGQAHCGHCHDPHPVEKVSNPKSLKFLDQPNRMCLQCHDRYPRDVELHTHHPVSSEASRCVSCHMPPIMNSLLFQAGSHQIEIPRAEMTLRFGQEESPNACLICHSTKSATWVKAQLQRW
jgi:tetratricopeptide (TPR) repeat protein